jgi:hypothetical protein
MDIPLLKECLQKAGIEELAIPVILPTYADHIFSICQWALEGKSTEGRQIWFCVGDAKEIQNQFTPYVRNRVMPLSPSLYSLYLKRGPAEAFLLPPHGFSYSDPNFILNDFWKQRGYYKKCIEFQNEHLQLWFWEPKQKPLKIFAMDHHHAVLWDVKKILKPLGIQVDFHWLSDGRPPVNEAIPSTVPSFSSSLDIYRPPADEPLSDECKHFIKEGNYDAILTSHSIVTAHRLKDCGLPHIHVNSTRFGNDWIQDVKKHEILVQSIQELFHQDRLTVVHNNKGDAAYFHQYFPRLNPHQEIVIPSLCESHLRLRNKMVRPVKLLLWDTRQVLLQPDGSPFMKELYTKCKDVFQDAIDSQAILLAKAQSFLPEGYLDNYTAVIHIPYNISTMSMFQQVRSNIPIWIPSKQLLAKLWSDPKEPNELSWTVFSPGSEKNASSMDQIRDKKVIERWLDTADFYNPDVLPLALPFDSIEDLLEKAMTTDYQTIMNISEKNHEQRRQDIFYAWERVIQKLRNRPKGGTQ